MKIILFNNRKILIPFLLALGINIISWLLFSWRIVSRGGEAFLHYTVYLGIDGLGPVWQVFYVSAVGLLILLVNTLIILYRKKSDTIAYSLIYQSLFVQILILIVSVFLVLINI